MVLDISTLKPNMDCQVVTSYSNNGYLHYAVYRENFVPYVIFVPLALLYDSEFNTGQIELYIKDYIMKLERWRF